MTNFSFNELIKCGNENYENRDYEGGIDDFSKAIEINPRKHEAYYNRGLAKKTIKDYSGAISDYKKAIDIYPYYWEAFSNLGNLKNQSQILNQEKDQMPVSKLR